MSNRNGASGGMMIAQLTAYARQEGQIEGMQASFYTDLQTTEQSCIDPRTATGGALLVA